MDSLISDPGNPFDIILAVGRTTEDGRSVSPPEQPDQLYALVGRLLQTYTDTNVGLQTAAQLNNSLRLLGSTTASGEARMLVGPGYLRAEFDGGAVARTYLAPKVMSLALRKWSVSNDDTKVRRAESDAANLNHMSSDHDLLSHCQFADSGAPFFAEYDQELTKAWQGRRPKQRQIAPDMVTADEIHREHRQEATVESTQRLTTTCAAYEADVALQAHHLAAAIGPAAGSSLLTLAVQRLDGVRDTLAKQRDALAEEVAQCETKAAELLNDLDHVLATKRGPFHSHRRLVTEVIAAISQAHRYRYGFDLTEGAIGTLSRQTAELLALQQQFVALISTLGLIAKEFDKAVAAFEEHRPSPVEELVSRPLYEATELCALYEETVGAPWGVLTDEVDSALRLAAGNLAEWLNRDPSDVLCRALEAGVTLVAPVTSTSADQFVAWKCRKFNLQAELVLRQLVSLAPILARYDEMRVPETDGMYPDQLTIIGVNNAAESTFANTGQGLLVSTDDAAAITILRLHMGLPASALWGFDRMQAAFMNVKSRGLVAQDIYPGLAEAGTDRLLSPPPEAPRRKTRTRRTGAAL